MSANEEQAVARQLLITLQKLHASIRQLVRNQERIAEEQ